MISISQFKVNKNLSNEKAAETGIKKVTSIQLTQAQFKKLTAATPPLITSLSRSSSSHQDDENIRQYHPSEQRVNNFKQRSQNSNQRKNIIQPPSADSALIT